MISGAGGVQPGLMMSQRHSVADGQRAVALTGRVYCLVDFAGGAIQPGDFLTISSTPGHAMKEGVAAAGNGTTISIRGGTYDETGTTRIAKRVHVAVTNGTVQIQ